MKSGKGTLNLRSIFGVALAAGSLALIATTAQAQYSGYGTAAGGSVVTTGPYVGGGYSPYYNPYSAFYASPYGYNYGGGYYGGGYNGYVNGYDGYGGYNGYNGGAYPGYGPNDMAAYNQYYYGYAPNDINNGPAQVITPDGSGANVRPVRVAAPRVLPRTTDTIEARRERGNKFFIGWKGENSTVSKITFAMLDLNKRAIMTRTVTQPPGEYSFPITTRMVYYQVVVEYVNGTTNTVTSPL